MRSHRRLPIHSDLWVKPADCPNEIRPYGTHLQTYEIAPALQPHLWNVCFLFTKATPWYSSMEWKLFSAKRNCNGAMSRWPASASIGWALLLCTLSNQSSILRLPSRLFCRCAWQCIWTTWPRLLLRGAWDRAWVDRGFPTRLPPHTETKLLEVGYGYS